MQQITVTNPTVTNPTRNRQVLLPADRVRLRLLRAEATRANLASAVSLAHDVITSPILSLVAAYLIIESAQSIPTRDGQTLYSDGTAKVFDAGVTLAAIASSEALRDVVKAGAGALSLAALI